jgi:large subunit ribosomal protein L5
MANKNKQQAEGAEQKPAKAKKGKGKGKADAARPRRQEAMPRLKERYYQEIRPALIKRFNYKSEMEAPRLTKIVLNMGVGEGSRDIKVLDSAAEELTMIAGQRANIRRAKRSIAAFKVRDGMPVGCAVTLRGARMYEFLDRLINVACPRIRDFRGLPRNAFDGRGNHSMGIREHLVFTELEASKVSRMRGLNITTVTTAKTDEEAFELLKLFGMPFRES